MSNYVKATNFFTKDALLTGNPDKIIKGSEIDDEYNALATAVASKADTTSPTFTGSPQTPTATAGNSTGQIASTAFVTGAVGALGNMSLQNKTAVDITGGTIAGVTAAGTFTGNLTGNVTGNVTGNTSGSSGSCTGNSATATLATNVTNGIGVSQTWQAMSTAASPANLQRLANTNYTNSTSKPIMVSITAQGTLQITVGGVIAARSGVDNAQNSLTVIVPAGAVYSCNQAGTWAELR